MQLPGSSFAASKAALIYGAVFVPAGSTTSAAPPPAASKQPVRFVGMVGDDADADDFEAALKEHGVEPFLNRSTTGAATATCLCLVGDTASNYPNILPPDYLPSLLLHCAYIGCGL